MSEATAKPGPAARPQFRNLGLSDLRRYRLPLAGTLSILHRISGALMFLVGLPVLLYLFDKSITSEISFETFREVTSHWLIKLVLLAMIWGYLHHLCAGVRFLFLDLHVGVQKETSRRTAIAVFGVSLALTLIAALKLFGAF